jgi:two-component system response regulator AtoC
MSSSTAADATLGLTLPYTVQAAARTYLVIQVADADPPTARVIDLAEDAEVTIGRSRSATIAIDHERISRTHARFRRRGERLEVEDLDSRNGTLVNGTLVRGVTKLVAGDVVVVGPATILVGTTTPLRGVRVVVDADAFDGRLRAELDRCARYRRVVALGLWRCDDDAQVDAAAARLRGMDLVGDLGGGYYGVIVPEVDREVATKMIADVTAGQPALAVAAVVDAPTHGRTADELIAAARAAARRGGRAATPAAPVDGPIVLSTAMKALYELVHRVADAAVTVLVLGETGAGKEHVAQAIHRASRRRAQPLVTINCAAVSETLLESEMFGHERGAFTGADRRRVGYFEAAAGGTLFLDEIGEMPASLQAKLLRVLERRAVTRVGGTDEIPVDVRIIAATHRDLPAEVAAGRFREDLYFRVSGFSVVVPALRDRREEIVPIAERFVREFAADHGRVGLQLGETARAALLAYDWPGNVRELRNTIERAVIMCDGARLDELDLPGRIAAQVAASGRNGVRDQVADLERSALVSALAEERGNQTRAARRLGLSRRALIYKMEKYGLKSPPHVTGN